MDGALRVEIRGAEQVKGTWALRVAPVSTCMAWTNATRTG
jgi:hypothetical protein